MSFIIGLFHATLNAVPGAEAAWRAADEPVSLRHYLDEGILSQVRQHGINPEVRARLQHWLQLIASDGADAIMTTCSSLSPVIPELRSQLSCPIVGIDDAMIDEAMAFGSRIAIVATLDSAAETTRTLFLDRANGKPMTVTTRVAAGAFDSLRTGDFTAHDQAVRNAVGEASAGADVVVLAQLSMARALNVLAEAAIPVLTSGASAVRRTLLAAQARKISKAP